VTVAETAAQNQSETVQQANETVNASTTEVKAEKKEKSKGKGKGKNKT